MKSFLLVTVIAAIALLAGCHSRSMDDSKITAKIESKLVGDSKTSALKIRVATKDGVVTLSGTVPTDTEKKEAETLARSTNGVRSVQNDILVDASALGATNVGERAGEAAKNAGQSVSDATILAKLKTKLLADGITGTNIDVENGSVVLKGQVDDAREKTKAEEIARDTSGVKNVTNQLTVKKQKST